ncbi:MAG TPA: ADP-ribosylglycohydrolase family protein [Acidimicrobiales bacterium]|nr:ADP-ribosylglycohydrolase family protein [Acidimicrobiales bacterium]
MTSDRQLFNDDPTLRGDQGQLTPSSADTPASGRAAAARRSALWAAYGDALGWTSELTDDAGLRRRTRGEPLKTPISWKRHIGGRGGLTVLLPAGCYSDDTQLRLATSRAIGPNGFDVEAFSKVELPVWLGYALGGGNSTKAAARNLAKPSTSWFVNTYRGWLESGGNGAAMRIQPHIWAAPELDNPAGYLVDVMRNSICTHAHPVGLIGAVIHALTLAYTMMTGAIPQAEDLTRLTESAGELPAILANDSEAGQYWLTSWERHSRQSFRDTWTLTVKDTLDVIAKAATAVRTGEPDERYHALIDALNLTDQGRRGSGQLSAIAAVALTWCEPRPVEAMILAANALGTDTDTIATMAGALLGAACTEEPPGDIVDRQLISAEAERLTALAAGSTDILVHPYPDLLNWSAPKTQADALVTTLDGQLHVLGLGSVVRTLSEPLTAAQGGFAWQWVLLAIGQTLLIKRRGQLFTIPHLRQGIGDTDNATSRRRTSEARSVSVLDRTPHTDERSEPVREPEPTGASRRTAHTSRESQSGRPLDLDRVIAYLHREQLSDHAIGYAVRRVAREGTPEQVAAFLAVLLDLTRR